MGTVRTSQRRLQFILLLLAGSVLAAGLAPQAHATGYTLTTSVARTQESNTPGVTLYLNVTGAAVSTTYKFTWTVTDPTNHAANAANQTTTTAAQTSFVLSVNYPSSFGGNNINFVGNYTINVQQNNPTSIPTVATGSFLSGLTDKTSYERTLTVSIQARGYNNNSPVTLNISHQATQAPGYPKILTTDGTGILSTAWTIPANVPTGLWTVYLTNTAPTKSVIDNQTLTILSANMTIPSLNIAQASLQRLQKQSFSFTATYPNGSSVRIGSAQILMIEPNGTRISVQANYNSTATRYSAAYVFPPSAVTGSWQASLQPGSFNDSYGNLGPQSTLVANFTIGQVSISIAQLNIGQTSINRTQTQTFSFTAKYPDGTLVRTGSAQVRVTETDGTTSLLSTATYNASLGVFHSTLKVPPTGETGAWAASIDSATFNDGFGNLGPSSGVARAFTVMPTNLTVSASIPSQTYTVGQVIPIYAIIIYPDGSIVTSGNVTATISTTNAQIGTVTLTFVQGQSEWIGAYTVKSTDPSGVILVTLNVSDPSGNTGQETISAIFSVPPTTPPPAPQSFDLYYFLVAALAIGSGGSGLLLFRRINSTHGNFDDEFFRLTGGDFAPGTTILLIGDPGSGTSTLSQAIIHHQLALGRHCGLLTYDAFPAEVIRTMQNFGWDSQGSLNDGKFKILDCYSALAGVENAPVRDPVDFTEISIQVSRLIENASPHPLTLVVDSITPIFNSAPARTVVNFLRVLSAKLKNANGILILTGARGSIPEEVRSNLETTADGVIQLTTTSSGQTDVRTLTVKRLAGRRTSPETVAFEIVPGKGILFKKLRLNIGMISNKKRPS
jgi:KaiC/GvpD/RAD55 family RecA-like ATPase